MPVSQLIIQAYNGYADAFVAKIPALTAAALVLAVFILLAGLTRFLTKRGRARRRAQLIGRLSQVAIVTVGCILALGILGVNLTGLVAGLGLISLGISFALQDLLVNFLAGIQLLGQSSYERGDHIKIGDEQGTIRFIGPRAVKLLADNGEIVYVPNREFLLKPVRVRKQPKV